MLRVRNHLVHNLTMNAKWFGDSFDIVKRFFLGIVKSNGYSIHIDPMFTGDWDARSRDAFLSLLGESQPINSAGPIRSALFLDPDTGIGKRLSRTHTTVAAIAQRATDYDLVIVFDQAFSRSIPSSNELQRKLLELRDLGIHGFYYDSHARFLFCSRLLECVASFHEALLGVGLPPARFIWANAQPG
jgi:hypothetical protein